MLRAPLGQRLVDWATSQLGVAEQPTGSNAGPPLERYGLPKEDPLPWCARFVRQGFVACDADLPGNRYHLAAGVHMLHVFEVHGWLLSPGSTPHPGDVAFFKRRDPKSTRGMHVAFVALARGAQMFTIGGNEGDAVRKRLRDLYDTDLVAFGRRPEP